MSKLRNTLVKEALDDLRGKVDPDSITPTYMADTIDKVSSFDGCPNGAVDVTRVGIAMDGTDETAKFIELVGLYDRLYIPTAEESGTSGELILSDSIHMDGKQIYIGGTVVWRGKGKPLFWMHRFSRIEGGVGKGTTADRHIYQDFPWNSGQTGTDSTITAGDRGYNEAMILIHKSGGGRGCLENRVHNIIMDGVNISGSGIYSSSENTEIRNAWDGYYKDPENPKPEDWVPPDPDSRRFCVGKGIWMLAGTDRGMSQYNNDEIPTYNYMEYVYRNAVTNTRINGFEDGVLLEAGWLWIRKDPADPTKGLKPALRKAGTSQSPNGWVNGNLFDGIWLRNCRNYLHLDAPKGNYYPIDEEGTLSKSATLCGECSGNHFNGIDIQTSSGTYKRGILVAGSDFNQFEVMHWDADQKYFPLVEFKRGNTNFPVGVITAQSRQNSVRLVGSELNFSNGGLRDEYAGNNTFDTADVWESNILPIRSYTNSERRSFIGVTQNYWGNMENMEEDVKLFKLNEDGSRGDRVSKSTSSIWTGGSRQELKELFNPEPGTGCKLSNSSTRGYEFEIISKHPISPDMVGFVYRQSEHTHLGCEVRGYDEGDNLKTRYFINAINAGSGFYDGGGNMVDENHDFIYEGGSHKINNFTNIKRFVFRFWDPERVREGGALSLSNFFCTLPKERSDLYHARVDKPNSFYHGDTHKFPMANSGSSFVEGYIDTDGKTFVAGDPSSEKMRELGVSSTYEIPVIAKDELIIKGDDGSFYKLVVSGGTLSATPVTL